MSTSLIYILNSLEGGKGYLWNVIEHIFISWNAKKGRKRSSWNVIDHNFYRETWNAVFQREMRMGNISIPLNRDPDPPPFYQP